MINYKGTIDYVELVPNKFETNENINDADSMDYLPPVEDENNNNNDNNNEDNSNNNTNENDNNENNSNLDNDSNNNGDESNKDEDNSLNSILNYELFGIKVTYIAIGAIVIILLAVIIFKRRD